MGVFTVGRQVALEIDMPGWWLANASVDMDFRRGLYYDSSTANPRAATDFLSCTRASVGYAKTAEGMLTSFASNALRVTSAGLLIEDARTNLATFSQDFNSWTADPANVSTDTTVAPDGTTTADTMTALASGSSKAGRYRSGMTTGAGATATYSMYAKSGTNNYFYMSRNNGATNYLTAVFNLSTGAVGETKTGGTATLVAASVETLANGWYRCIVTGSVNLADPDIEVGICALPTGNAFNVDGTISSAFAGTETILLWGAQYEIGTFPSSYIPTTGAAATRAAENITTSSSLQTAINAATGSLVAQTDSGGGAGFAANIVDSNGTNLLGFDASSHALASIIGTLATSNTANRTTQDKLGIAWSGAGRSLVLNGGTVATDASAQTPSATQHIGSTGTTNFIYAYIERLSLFTAKLADATLQGFTV